jgi:2-dehydropantoate 2-reductase
MNLRYSIIGTGGLGGFYGGQLAKSGKEVHFLVRSDYDFIREKGLKVDSVKGNYHLPKINVYNDPKKLPACDVVCICLKTTRNQILPGILSQMDIKTSLLLFIQNGLGIEEELAAHFPDNKIAGGLAYLCSTKKGPGHIYHQDHGELTVGAHSFNDTGLLNKIAADFIDASVPTKVTDDLQLARWKKLVWNIPFNGLTVTHNTTTDQLMKSPETRQTIYGLMLEVIQGAAACGRHIDDSFADQLMDFTDKMKPYAPSMKVDFDKEKPLETKYIYKKPVETAAASGFNMSKTEALGKELDIIQLKYS